MNTLGDAVPLNIFVRIHEIFIRARNLNVKTWHHEFSRKKLVKSDTKYCVVTIQNQP